MLLSQVSVLNNGLLTYLLFISQATSLSWHLAAQGFDTSHKLISMWNAMPHGPISLENPWQPNNINITFDVTKENLLIREYSGVFLSLREEARLPPPQVVTTL